MTTKKILIIGNLGYIGPVLARYLKSHVKECELIGYDSGYFGHCNTNVSVLPEALYKAQYFGDVRDFDENLLSDVDAVVYLAAISNDPMGNKFEAATAEINQNACLRIAAMAQKSGVKNFVFASSCSVYGYAEGGARKETDQTNPLTAYARSKIGTEEALKQANLGKMVVTCLRFATACGMSERLRLDLVLNDFVACAIASGEITILSDGTPWRPLIDVEDMSRAICWAAQRTPQNGGQLLFINIGRDDWNYQVKELAEAVARAVPGTKIHINTSAQPDKRSYKVDFSLFKELAPQYIPQLSLDQSIDRLVKGLQEMKFADKDFRNSPYIRLKTLEAHMSANRLNSDLRWN